MKKIARTLCLIWLGIFGCAGILLFTGCSWKQEKPEKTNLAFTVVDEARLPEELLKLVAEKKEASFKMTYADSGYLYLCVGYGKQDSGAIAAAAAAATVSAGTTAPVAVSIVTPVAGSVTHVAGLITGTAVARPFASNT